MCFLHYLSCHSNFFNNFSLFLQWLFLDTAEFFLHGLSPSQKIFGMVSNLFSRPRNFVCVLNKIAFNFLFETSIFMNNQFHFSIKIINLFCIFCAIVLYSLSVFILYFHLHLPKSIKHFHDVFTLFFCD